MNIPKQYQQAFTQSNWGTYFVRYPNGESSALMDKRSAKTYSNVFNGTIFKRLGDYGAQEVVPFNWFEFTALFCAGICVIAALSVAAMSVIRAW